MASWVNRSRQNCSRASPRHSVRNRLGHDRHRPRSANFRRDGEARSCLRTAINRKSCRRYRRVPRSDSSTSSAPSSAQGGIAITASHNPAEWNALKFIGSNGLFLDAGQARELLDIYHQGEYTRVGGTELRTVEEVEGATDLHIKSILDVLGPLPKTARTCASCSIRVTAQARSLDQS